MQKQLFNLPGKIVFIMVILLAIAGSCRKDGREVAESGYTYETHAGKLQYLDTKDGRMAFLDEGNGPVILLVHGVPTSSWLYRKMTPVLVQAGYRVVVPDLLGYGASDKPEGHLLYAPDKMGARLLTLMEHLGVDEWAQVFHDGGGLWTWEMLKQDASKVNHLFMLNTIVYEGGFKPPIRFEEGMIAKQYAKQYSTGMGQKIVIKPTFKNGIRNRKVINDVMLEGYKLPFLDEGYDALYYFFTRTCNDIPDYNELHRSLDIPLTVIWGKHDDMLVWDGNKDQLAANFDLGEDDIHLIDAKHFIQEERPEEVAGIILKSIAQKQP